jgi:AsmA protein
MRKLLIALFALTGLLVLGAVGVSMFVDVNQFRPLLEQELTSAVGRRVGLGKIKLALFSGSIAIDDLSIADDDGFGGHPFVTAKTVKVGVDLLPLMLSRSLHVRSFTLEQPHIILRRSPAGRWNVSTLGTSSPAARATASGGGSHDTRSAPGMSISKLTVSNGQVTVVASTPHGRNRVYDAVDLEATDLSYVSQFPFRLTAKTPGGGTVQLEGRAGPLDPNDASTTPLDAKIQVKHLDLAATGFVDPTAGLAGILDFSGALSSDGRELRSKGTLSANKLQVVRGSAPSRVPIQVDYQSAYDLKRQTGSVSQGDVRIGRALARLTGSYRNDGEAMVVRMKVSGRQMPVPELEASLPAVGVTLPAGASLKNGTLDLELLVSGPVDRLVTTGPVTVANTTVTGFDLGARMGAVAALAGLPRSASTVIQLLSSTIRVAPDGIRADNLDLVVPSIGTLTGGGLIAPRGALDFKMLARLTHQTATTSALARVASLGHPENGTPFLIKGTTSSPVFAPDVSAAVRGLATKENAATSASGLLKGLLGRKQK